MFSVVFRSFFPAFLIRLRAHFNFSLTIPHSTKLVSKEENNCNNMTFGAESFQSGSHVKTIIQNLTLVSSTSFVMPCLVGLPLRAAIPSLPMYSIPYTLIFLRTRLLMHSSHHYVCVSAETTFCLGIYLKLSTC